MKKIKNVKIKPKFALFLKVICFVLCVFIGIFVFYCKQISQLTSLNYSKEASRKILFSKNKDYVDSIIKTNSEKAAYIANKTLRKVQKKVGLPERVR